MAEGVTLGQAIVFLRGDRRGLDKDLDEGEKKTKSWAARLGGNVARLLGGAIVAGAAAAAGAVAGIGIAAFAMSSTIDQSVKKAASQLNQFSFDAEEFGDMLKTVYGKGFGESIDDVAQSLVTVRQNMADVFGASNEGLDQATEAALALRDAFELDVSESTRVAAQMVKNFGIEAEDAFSIIGAGFQYGLNSSEDLLDTLNEYSADFRDLGFTADQFLSTLSSGLGVGIYNTDKIADLFREFKINLMDTGRLEAIHGLNEGLDEAIRRFQKGEINGRQAFSAIQRALQDIDDPLARQQAGVALMGSLWEDLGAEAVLAIDTASDSLTNNVDVMDSLMQQYDTWPSLLEGLKRRVLLAFTPLGDKLLDIINKNMPLIESAFAWLEDKLPGIVETAGAVLETLFWPLIDFLSTGDLGVAFDDLREGIMQIFGEEVGGKIRAFVDQFTWVVYAFRDVKEDALRLADHILSLVTDGFGAVKAWLDENWITVQAVVMTVLIVIQDAIGALVDVFKQEILPAFIEIYNQLTFALKDLGLEWGDVWKAIGTAVKIVAGIVGAILLALVGTIVGIVTGIARAIAAAVKAFREMGEHIGGVVRGVMQFFTGLLEFFKRLFAGDFPGALDALKFAFEGAWLFIESMVGLIWASIKGTFNVIKAFIGGFIDSFIGFFKNLYDRLVGHSIITDLVNEILRLFQSINLLEIGRKMIQGFINGINEKKEELKAKIRELAESLPDWMKDPLNMHSPSLVFAEIGQNVMAGLAQGLADAAPLAAAQLQLAAGRLAFAGAGTTNYNQYFFGIPGLGTQREAGDAGYRLHQDLKRRGQA